MKGMAAVLHATPSRSSRACCPARAAAGRRGWRCRSPARGARRSGCSRARARPRRACGLQQHNATQRVGSGAR